MSTEKLLQEDRLSPGLYKPIPKRCYKAFCRLSVTFAVVDQNGNYRGEFCTEHAKEVYNDVRS